MQMERKKNRLENPLRNTCFPFPVRIEIYRWAETSAKTQKCANRTKSAVETFQRVKEDNVFKHTVYNGYFPIESTKNVSSICFPSGVTGIFVLIVSKKD